MVLVLFLFFQFLCKFEIICIWKRKKKFQIHETIFLFLPSFYMTNFKQLKNMKEMIIKPHALIFYLKKNFNNR